MQLPSTIVLLHQRDHYRRIGGSARAYERRIGHCRSGTADEISYLQGVDQARCVFDLPIQPDQCCICAGFLCMATAGKRDHLVGQHFDNGSATGANFELQIRDELPGPVDCKKRSHCKAVPWRRRPTRPVYDDVRADCHEFPNLELHTCLPSLPALKLVGSPCLLWLPESTSALGRPKSSTDADGTCPAMTTVTFAALYSNICLSDLQSVPGMTWSRPAFCTRLWPGLFTLPFVLRSSTTTDPVLPAGIRPCISSMHVSGA